MCTNNWPLLLDLSRDECKRILRRLELEAYSAVLTAFRAQGDLSKDKKGILQELQNILSISTERHRAEVRRAVNDEKLTTIADNMAGPDVSSEWQIEGRRLIPLMPRLVPQTAFTVTANNAASMQAEKNLSLPPPSQTGSKEVIPTPPTTPSSATPAMAPKAGRPTSPASNVVVLPSGMSIHIKGGLNTDEEEAPTKKGRRSSSTEAAIITKTTQTPAPVVVTKPTIASASPTMSPMKITFTKSPAKQQQTNVSQSQQKVILVSTTTQAGSTPTIVQKSMAVPVIKTTTTTGGTVTTFTSPRASIIMPSSMGGTSSVANGNLGSVMTVSTTSSTGIRTSIPTVTALATANPTLLASSMNAMRPRTKMITTRPKMSPRAGMVMQMGPSHMAGSPMAHGSQGIHNIHVKPVHTKPTIHIKHEGGMKIITQGMPTSGSKILPKPPGSAQGSPMVVMSSAQPSITMMSKSNTSLAGQVAGGRVLNITTQGGKVIASSSNRGTAANVVTVNPKTLQLTAIKGAGGTTVLTTSGRVATATGAKPNVIVVQKAQPKRFATSTATTMAFPRPSGSATSTANSTMEKKHEVMKHVPQKTIVTKQTMMTKSGMEIKRQPQPYAVRVRSDGMSGEGGRSSLLAELIQAVGIQPDSSGEATTTPTGATVGMEETDPSSGIHTVVVQQEEVVMTSNPNVVTVPAPTTSKEVGGNRWVEYDVPRGQQTLLHTGRDSSDTSAIKALLDLQTGAKQQPRPKPLTNLDLSQIRIQHQDRYAAGQSALSRAVTSTTPSTNRTLHFTQARTQQQLSEPLTTNVVLEQPDGETVAVQLAGADLAHLSSMTMGQEIIGELDPETGIFYTTAPGGGEESVTVVTTTHQPTQQQVAQPPPQVQPPPHQQRYVQQQTPVSVVRAATVTTTAAAATKPIDFLSSALSTAQIDLDPYQFIEEDEPAFGSKQTVGDPEPDLQQPTEGSLVQILTPDTTMPVATEESVESQELNLEMTTGSLTGVEPSSTAVGLRLPTPTAVPQEVMRAIAPVPVSVQSTSPAPSQVHPTQTQGSLQTRPTPIQTIRVTTVPTPRSVTPTVQTTAQTVMSTTVLTTRPTISTVVPSVVSAVKTTHTVVSPVVTAQASIAPEQAVKVTVSTVQQSTQPLVSTVQLARPAVVPVEVLNRTVTTSIPTFQTAAVAATSTVQVMQSIVSTGQSAALATTQAASVNIASTPTLPTAAAAAAAPIVDIPTIETLPVIIPTIETALPAVSTLVPSVSDEVPSSTTEGAPVEEGTLLQPQGPEILEEMVVSDGIIDFAQHEVCVPETASNVTVAVEPGGLDTTTMIIEDFTSQQYITDTTEPVQSTQGGELLTIEYAGQGEGAHLDDLTHGSPPGVSEGPGSSGESGDPGVSPVRASSRKRRPPSMPDDSPPHGHGNMSSWVRHASSLLQKVCKYRGSRKEKGELNASAWFLAPVDPKEVPDYYEIIKQPMDFGTIRHKLETSQYAGWDDFHTDMLLVQENCRRYNPPGHEIRRDCEEVFNFYTHEYEWGRDKWQKQMSHSVTPKKPRMDRSPMRT